MSEILDCNTLGRRIVFLPTMGMFAVFVLQRVPSMAWLVAVRFIACGEREDGH